MKTYMLIVDTNSIKRDEFAQISSKVYASYEEFEEEVNPEEKGIEVYLLTDFISSINDEAISTKGSWIGYVHILEKQTVWLLEQYDQHFSCSSRVPFGLFTSREKAIEAMDKNYSKEALGEDAEFYENGTNQWISNVHNCGIKISEVELDKFEEL